MKRDMDLVRAILLEVEKHEPYKIPKSFPIEGYEAANVSYHCHLLCEAGLLTGADVGTYDNPNKVLVTGITWQGHDFIDATRNDTVWARTKGEIEKVGSASWEIWTSLAAEALKKMVGL